MSFIYDLARNAFANGGINWGADTIVAYLVEASYTPAQATDQYLSTIVTGSRAGGPITLTTKTEAAGVVGADNITFPSVPTGPACNAIVLVKSTGVDATSPLIAYIDQISGFPITPNGGNIGIAWDTGPLKIFKL